MNKFKLGDRVSYGDTILENKATGTVWGPVIPSRNHTPPIRQMEDGYWIIKDGPEHDNTLFQAIGGRDISGVDRAVRKIDFEYETYMLRIHSQDEFPEKVEESHRETG